MGLQGVCGPARRSRRPHGTGPRLPTLLGRCLCRHFGGPRGGGDRRRAFGGRGLARQGPRREQRCRFSVPDAARPGKGPQSGQSARAPRRFGRHRRRGAAFEARRAHGAAADGRALRGDAGRVRERGRRRLHRCRPRGEHVGNVALPGAALLQAPARRRACAPHCARRVFKGRVGRRRERAEAETNRLVHQVRPQRHRPRPRRKALQGPGQGRDAVRALEGRGLGRGRRRLKEGPVAFGADAAVGEDGRHAGAVRRSGPPRQGRAARRAGGRRGGRACHRPPSRSLALRARVRLRVHGRRRPRAKTCLPGAVVDFVRARLARAARVGRLLGARAEAHRLRGGGGPRAGDALQGAAPRRRHRPQRRLARPALPSVCAPAAAARPARAHVRRSRGLRRRLPARDVQRRRRDVGPAPRARGPPRRKCGRGVLLARRKGRRHRRRPWPRAADEDALPRRVPRKVRLRQGSKAPRLPRRHAVRHHAGTSARRRRLSLSTAPHLPPALQLEAATRV
mmetsp:Transcript_2346/g.6969  ORF Transcript_2346/g.6969 Transcript_2346/m.6969 type:complete len:510 (-) Transcript_2346:963-2492(-)